MNAWGTMKKSLIPWHVFREALEGQGREVLEQWLDHWGFTNDGVVLISADSRSQLPVLFVEPRGNGTDVVALNPGVSLGELLQFLTRDATLFMGGAAELWSYTKEL